MSNADLTNISHETSELFKEFDNEYLADVLRVWDCDNQEWFDCFAVVFRFENNDLLIWKGSDNLCATVGAVETSSIDASFLETFTPIISTEKTLSWKFDSDYKELVGEKDIISQLLFRLAQVCS